MRPFLETSFGPTELEIIEAVLNHWRKQHAVPKESPDADIAAAVMINLFREGYQTIPELSRAAADHKALSELVP